MSSVTDIVFITRSREVAERFADIVEQTYDGFYPERWRPEPTDGYSGKVPGAKVFYMGLKNDHRTTEALRAEPWPADTVLWIETEEQSSPDIVVSGKFVAVGAWWDEYAQRLANGPR